ncbi:hypothetical protein IscW_ISCW012370, partial [Ixodes scapularis]
TLTPPPPPRSPPPTARAGRWGSLFRSEWIPAPPLLPPAPTPLFFFSFFSRNPP